MDRRDYLLSVFDPSGFGLEIGPSYNPLLRKSDGYNVETVDHVDADALREKYRDNNLVDISRIEDVDYVSDGRSLVDLIGQSGRYDFVYASHVIEHVPDIIRFIRDCEALLKPDGVLVLAVPDKRFCFDVLRPLSTVGQALQAFHEQRTRPNPGTVFDHVSLFSSKAGNTVWIEPSLDDVKVEEGVDVGHSAFQKSSLTNDYTDVHAWQFTPSSFRYLIKVLRQMGHIKYGERSYHKNPPGEICQHEFYVTLNRNAPICDLSETELLRASELELHEINPSMAMARTIDALLEKVDDLTVKLEETDALLARERHDRQALLASTSWRVTAFLRYISSIVRPKV